jgi:hypothetical protein
MCPYIVNEGRQVYKHPQPYRCGDFVPGSKGELADLEADGAVRWVDSPPREPKQPAAKRKAVK